MAQIVSQGVNNQNSYFESDLILALEKPIVDEFHNNVAGKCIRGHPYNFLVGGIEFIR